MEIWTAFILGLAGSLHCAGMCGPLALALPATGKGTWGFVLGRGAYNLGRMITYGALGILFGIIGKTLWLAGIQRWVSIGLGVALLAGLFTARTMGLSRPVTALVARLKTGMSGLLRKRSLSGSVLLGLLNGLLPCGLVYVACAGATKTSVDVAGAKYMAAFGVGTLPIILAICLSGRLVPVSLRLKLRRATPVSVFVLAMLLILRGMSLGIPYLSPNLAGGGMSCCHP